MPLMNFTPHFGQLLGANVPLPAWAPHFSQIHTFSNLLPGGL